MLGLRTPPKSQTSAPGIRRSIDKWEEASSQGPRVAKEAPLAGAGGGGKSPAPAQTREKEAKNCYLKAISHLAESRNIKTDIKTGVQTAVKRLYQLVKEAEEESPKNQDKPTPKGKKEILSDKLDKH
ncbi:unnamed protein product [Pieris macdunnoughi]|uniref:Uncharacterized protein n=1 Tax=Pieris macdunnoughi TaxID=345717 RepID=A0A821LPQ0_9NEOP|nr:unnamed protein product [Pieris macdunnoughi]